MTDASTLPAIPTVPTKWTVTNAIAFAGAAAVSIIGLLTMLGVTVPAGVSTEVQTLTGALTTVAGAITGLLALVSKHSVQKAAINAGVPLADALRL